MFTASQSEECLFTALIHSDLVLHQSRDAFAMEWK